MELIERVERGVPLPELLAAFNEPSTSDYLVVYLRLLTSGCLQRHRRFFEQFLEGGRSIKEFCQQVGRGGPCMGLVCIHRGLGGLARGSCALTGGWGALHGAYVHS